MSEDKTVKVTTSLQDVQNHTFIHVQKLKTKLLGQLNLITNSNLLNIWVIKPIKLF